MYQLIAGRIQAEGWSFMNYGYAPLDGQVPPLTAAEERDRYAIQLYAHVVEGIDLSGADVLEIGSGRGGGAAYLSRSHGLRRMVGVDFAERAVALSRTNHRAPELAFLTGDAEHVPLGGGSFDIVINVESSHCYASMDAFLHEVKRLLKPGGVFLFADFRDRDAVGMLEEQIRRSGMSIARRRDITAEVLHALDLGTEARIAWVREIVPWYLRGLAREFAGVQGSNMYDRFRSGSVRYQSYQLCTTLK
jgi:ubiquinone/menaquinone biosynthesis C-methylase UbiE